MGPSHAEAIPDGARQGIISDDEFRGVLASKLDDCFRFVNLLMQRPPIEWLRRHFVELGRLAHDLETMLDDHGARNNKSFSYFTELIASVRGLAAVGSILRHVLARFPRYGVQIGPDDQAQFFSETEVTNRFISQSMLGLLRAVYEELERLNVKFPSESATEESVHDEGMRFHLHHNIDEEDVVEEEQRIAEIATKYLAASDALAWVSDARIDGRKELRDFVLAHLDEERSRHYEGLVHSLQSKYDTYIKNTTLEGRHASLPRLRGHVSLALHLLEVCTQLVHFYERHENDIRYEAAKARIARIVDKTELLDRLVNYCLRFAHLSLDSGKRFAEEALRTFVRVQRLEVALPDGMALHARPISLIVRIVAHYGTHVEMEIAGESANAGSIMELIMLVGGHADARSFVFRGDTRPLQDIRLLFENSLGEEGLDLLPGSLDYLRT